jgi:hypothetical protein
MTASQTVEIALSVWLDQISRNLLITVPRRITMKQSVEQTGRELAINIGEGSNWQLWREDKMAAPPLVEGEEYGLVPAETASKPTLEPIKKRDIDFTSEIRRHGKMIAVTVTIAKVQQRIRTPQEVTLSQLIRKHMAVPSLPAETMLSWGRITGRGAPGRLQEDDMVEIKLGNPEVSRCFVYQGWGQFAEPFEVDLNAIEEPEFIAEANRLNPEP